MKREPMSVKSVKFCCEDHFNIESDTENYLQFKLVDTRLRLKADTLLHIFDCQKEMKNVQPRSAVEKRHRAEFYENLLTKEVRPSVALQPTEFVECNEPEIQEVKEPQDPIFVSRENDNVGENKKTSKNKATQVNLQCKKSNKGCQASIRQKPLQIVNTDTVSEDDTISDINSTDRSISLISENEFLEEVIFEESTLRKIKRAPQLYLGLSQEQYFMIELLVNHVQATQVHILVTLKKVRLNDSYSRLALDFDLQKGSISKIFRKTIKLVADYMSQLIYFPKPEKIEENLPLAFSTRFHKTQSIIDCFEIRTEKPSNVVHQSLTWSDYKSCNTLKYLISITPDGFINFISKGYGGRISDTTLFEVSNILDEIPPGAAILADRGFKNIAALVERKGCALVRPPTVNDGTTISKVEVMMTKRIAAVRIHVERSIGRIRDFKMLAPHACVDVKMIPIMDSIMKVASGLVNLQSVLIKY